MSYSYNGLGQAKWVPGQISFSTLPQGQYGLPSVQPLLERGLPIAPYIEHGSFETGEPAIMRYGLDPYRGIMGLGSLGQTVGQSLRRLQAQSYVIRWSDRPGSPDRSRRVRGMNAAMQTCKAVVRRSPQAVCRALLLTGNQVGAEVFSFRQRRPGDYDVRFNYALAGLMR